MSKKAGSSKLTATKLRIILSLSLLLIIGAAGGGFVAVKSMLTQYATEVGHKKVDADASNGTISALETIKQELAKDQDVINKADELKSKSEFPEFTIVKDVTNYANKNGLTVESFSLSDPNASPTAGTGSGTTPTSQTTTPSGSGTAGSSASTGSKGVSMTITLKSTVNYKNLLQFMYDISQNLPKMQIQSISLGASTTSVDDVAVQPITIQMYTK